MEAKELESKDTEAIIKAEGWQLAGGDNGNFDANDVIDAYFNGKKQGAEDFRALVLEKLESNLAKSGALTAKCVSFIKEKGFVPVFAKLRINSFKNYSVLIGVREEDYINEDFLQVYNASGAMEIENESDLFSIAFHFAYQGKGFNERAVVNDGYKIDFRKI